MDTVPITPRNFLVAGVVWCGVVWRLAIADAEDPLTALTASHKPKLVKKTISKNII